MIVGSGHNTDKALGTSASGSHCLAGIPHRLKRWHRPSAGHHVRDTAPRDLPPSTHGHPGTLCVLATGRAEDRAPGSSSCSPLYPPYRPPHEDPACLSSLLKAHPEAEGVEMP